MSARGSRSAPATSSAFYTGWIEAFADERGDFQVNLLGVGLSPGKEIPRWLWDHRVAAVCADNTGLEAYPWEPQRGRSLHTGLLNFLGMPLGELFDLKHLAADCAADVCLRVLLLRRSP